MKITKFGHCCLLIEECGLRILIDPGTYSISQDSVKNIDVVLITHEHQDHLHIDSLKTVLKNNPNAEVITNQSVSILLKKENIPSLVLEGGKSVVKKDVFIEAFGTHHALIHSSIPPIENLGFFIANKFFYPGDAFTNPNKPIEILALPVAGPWMKLSEAIDYTIQLKPKICFPVHEGILKSPGSGHKIPPIILRPLGIKFMILDLDKKAEF